MTGLTPAKVRTFSNNESTGRATFHNDNADRFIDVVSDGEYDLTINGITRHGGLITPPLRVTSSYTLTSDDNVLFADTDGGAITVNLPSGVAGTNYKIVNCGSSANDVTVVPNGSEQISGASAATLTDGNKINIHFEATENWW